MELEKDVELTEAESSLVSMICHPGASVTFDVPYDPDPDTVWNHLTQLLSIHRKASTLAERLRPVIGKLLLIIRDNPVIFESRGYRTYESFLSKYVCEIMSMSRSGLYDARIIADRMPEISQSDYEVLGPTKLRDLAKFTKSSDPSFPTYVEEAKKRTAIGFRKWCEDQKLIEKGEADSDSIVIYTNRSVSSLWREFIAKPEVVGFVGSNSPSTILQSMIQECCSSWTAFQDKDEWGSTSEHKGE